MNEIWKDIYFEQNGEVWDYRGLYQISNFGNVKSLGNDKRKKEKILKARKNNNNYLFVELCKNGKIKQFLIHRLVAHMFLSDTYFDGADVDHINTNKQNNHHTNLRWCTRKENCNNELSKKHYSEAKKGKVVEGMLVARYDLNMNLIDIKYHFEYAQMGFNSGNISSCCKGKRKSCQGFIFRYHKEE